MLSRLLTDSSQAGRTGTIDLSDDDVEHIEKMIKFLYTSSYPSVSTEQALHIEMYAIGDKYDLPRLSKFAKVQFRDALHRVADHTVFLSLIPRIYESTPDSDRGLRDVAISNARRYYAVYTARNELKGKFNEVLQSTWLFTKDLLSDFAARPIIGSCATCGPGQVLRFHKKFCANCSASC